MKQTSRFYSKVLVAINIALCWSLAFYSTWHQQGEVAITALSIIAAIIATYIGTGHMDYRAVLQSMKRDSGMGLFNNTIDTSGQDQ